MNRRTLKTEKLLSSSPSRKSALSLRVNHFEASCPGETDTKNPPLVSHYSAIGDTISCDAPYSAIGFTGKLFLRYPPCWVCLWNAIGQFYRKKWGCSSDSLRYHRKHSATGVLLHLSRDRGGYFGRVTKHPPKKKPQSSSLGSSVGPPKLTKGGIQQRTLPGRVLRRWVP